MTVRELILALSEYQGDERVFFEVGEFPALLTVDVIEKDKDGHLLLREAE